MLRCDTWDLLGLLMKRGLIGCALGAALILPALSTLPASADQVASGEDLYILTSQDAGTAAYDGPLSTADRSEEHTSELQSLMRISYAVLCSKKKQYISQNISIQ